MVARTSCRCMYTSVQLRGIVVDAYFTLLGENNKFQVKYSDPKVCKSFLLACCPHEILSSTVSVFQSSHIGILMTYHWHSCAAVEHFSFTPSVLARARSKAMLAASSCLASRRLSLGFSLWLHDSVATILLAYRLPFFSNHESTVIFRIR